jgi:hypothetical protein
MKHAAHKQSDDQLRHRARGISTSPTEMIDVHGRIIDGR